MEEFVLKQLEESEALLTGHFLLSSGRHSNRYCQCAKLLQYPARAEKVVAEIVKKLQGVEIDCVVGPAMGGVIVSYELGRQLGKRTIFTERENNIMTLRRGFEVKKGEKILISEDVITTGKSSIETIQVLEQHGAEVVGVACVVNRSTQPFPYPIYDAIQLHIESWESSECPLCQQGIPFIKPGSRKIES